MTVGDTRTQLSNGVGLDAPSRITEILDGRYRVLGLIGAGGMGVVYEGEHVHVGRRVAIKFLRRDLATHPRLLQQFRFEARAAGQLASDNVAAVLDFGMASDGALYLVMEKLRGETLAQRLVRRHLLPAHEAVRIIAQASRGAQAAHNLGIVHCDLKPSNLFILVRDDGTEQVKLLDFGIARLSIQTGGVESCGKQRAMGTPSYMSPEQASIDANIDARTDVYALGVILYRMLCGKLPHGGSDPVAIRCRILREDPPDVRQWQPDVPAALADVVHRALARQAAQRYASAQELAQALEPFVEQVVQSAAANARRMDALPETLADPPTHIEQDSGYGSGIRHAVALDVASGKKNAHRQASMSRWFIGGAALTGIGSCALLAGWLGMERLKAESHAAGMPEPGPSGEIAQSLRIDPGRIVAESASANGESRHLEDSVAESTSPTGVSGNAEQPAQTSAKRTQSAFRRAVKHTTYSPAAAKANPTVDAKSVPAVQQTRRVASRNYDQYVGF